MELIFWMAGFFGFCAIGTAIVEWYEKRRGILLPDPDRSTQREAESQARQALYIRRMERQS